MSPQIGPLLAVVPARGGSKRIARKNIRPFHGVPLLGRTLSTVAQSSVFDTVIVSTDDEEIAEVAVRFGAEVPFVRPDSLADDTTNTQEVVRHALQLLPSPEIYTAVCCIYPTSVMLSHGTLGAAVSLLPGAISRDSFLISVVSFPHPPQRALRLMTADAISPVSAAAMATRTQDHEKLWHDAGQFYWAAPDRWISDRSIWDGAIGYRLDRSSVVDIDSEEDWRLAERLFLLASDGSQDAIGIGSAFSRCECYGCLSHFR